MKPTERIQVLGIVVLYNPNLERFQESLLQVAKQVDKVILIDNSFQRIAPTFFQSVGEMVSEKIEYVFNNSNWGVAKAQNFGLKWACSRQADFVIIFDQDSRPDDGMVDQLVADYCTLVKNGHRISAIGPNPINQETDKQYRPRLRSRKCFVGLPEVLNVSEIISSGSLIPVSVIPLVGYMDENLFIDGVDHEWCWRAGRIGYTCAISTRTKLQHMLGEGDRKIFGIRVAISSPVRVYYQYRNYFYLARKSYVPNYWKINNAIKYLIKFFYYPIFVSPKYLKNILRGIIGGLTFK